MFLSRLRLLIITLWVGSLWAIGYIAAPTLFATLADRMLAGTIAGSLFRVEAWVSLMCGGVLLVLLGRERMAGHRTLMVLVATMLLCTLIGYFGLQPLMAELRTAGLTDEAAKSRFGLLHGVASAIYLLQSLLGAVLIWKQR